MTEDSFDKTGVRTDSALEWALKWNKTNAIYYKGVLYPKGWLQKVLDLAKPQADGGGE